MYEICKNREDWDDFYFYRGYNPRRYPKKYPCLVRYRSGIYGFNDVIHEVLYMPRDLNKMKDLVEVYLLGSDARWEVIDV